MGLYSRFLFPFGCELAMSRASFAKLRASVLAGVTGDVLEIGFGTGLNLPHYPPAVRRLTAVDANPGMSRKARRRIAESAIAVEHRVLDCERLPIADESFDSAVSSWTLCSITDVGQALREIRRVLRPGGRFFFLEHGLSNEPKVQRWQHRLTPLQKIIGGGCHLNRNFRELIGEQLEMLELTEFYMEDVPRLGGYVYRGIAGK